MDGVRTPGSMTLSARNVILMTRVEWRTDVSGKTEEGRRAWEELEGRRVGEEGRRVGEEGRRVQGRTAMCSYSPDLESNSHIDISYSDGYM